MITSLYARIPLVIDVVHQGNKPSNLGNQQVTQRNFRDFKRGFSISESFLNWLTSFIFLSIVIDIPFYFFILAFHSTLPLFLPRLSKKQIENIGFPTKIKQIIVGMLLGDGCLSKATPNSNVRHGD
jgi:hypothetical protein